MFDTGRRIHKKKKRKADTSGLEPEVLTPIEQRATQDILFSRLSSS
jgi:hypothetical protein